MNNENKQSLLNYSYPKSALVTIHVENMERAIKFYEDVFGFQIAYNDARQLGWVEMTTHLDGLYLGLNQSLHGVTENQTAFTINVKEIKEAKERLEKVSIKTTEIVEFAGMIAMFFFFDSEGNRLVIASNSKM